MKISGVTYVKRKRGSKRLRLVITIVLLLLVGLMLLSGYNTWIILFPEKLSEEITDIKYKPVSFRTLDDSLTLRGRLFESENPDKILIMVHDYGRNMYQFSVDTRHLIREIVDNGYNVFIYNSRACGSSEGNKVSLGLEERKDVLGAVKAVRALGLGDKNIVVMGFGSGAASALMAAGDNARESGYIDAVIADSPYMDLDSYLSQLLPDRILFPRFPVYNLTIFFIKIAIGDLDPLSPINVVASLAPRPVLFIQGSSDSKNDARGLFHSYSSISPENAYFWEAPGSSAADNYTNAPSEYVKRIIEFLNGLE